MHFFLLWCNVTDNYSIPVKQCSSLSLRKTIIFHHRGNWGLNYAERTFSLQLRKLLQSNKSFSILLTAWKKPILPLSLFSTAVIPLLVLSFFSLLPDTLFFSVSPAPLRVHSFYSSLQQSLLFLFIWSIFFFHILALSNPSSLLFTVCPTFFPSH